MQPINIIRKVNKFIRPNRIAQELLAQKIKNSAKQAKGILIDIGCGSKPYQRFFDNNVSNYFGIDIPKDFRKEVNLDGSIKMPKIIKRAIGYHSRKTVPDIFGSAFSLPIKSKSIDTVLSTEVLEHLSESSVFLSEVKRVLKDNGIFILTTPFVWPYHEVPYDYVRFTEWGLKNLLIKNGFEVIDIIPYGNNITAIGMLISYTIDRIAGNSFWLYYPVKILCFLIQLFFLLTGKIIKISDLPFGNLIVAKPN